MQFLSGLPRPELLEYLYLPMIFLGRVAPDTSKTYEWTQLDDLLASDELTSRFPIFKRVWISIPRHALPHEFHLQIQKILPELMPRLWEKDMLRITLSNGLLIPRSISLLADGLK